LQYFKTHMSFYKQQKEQQLKKQTPMKQSIQWVPLGSYHSPQRFHACDGYEDTIIPVENKHNNDQNSK